LLFNTVYYKYSYMKIKSVKFIKGITGDDEILHDRIPEIAFVGRSNVGKSSLINSILNVRELARTGKKPGKTIEVNFYLVNEKYYFVDLPGYGFAQRGLDEREKIREIMINYITRNDSKIHTVAIIVDSKVGLTEFDREMLDILNDCKLHAVLILSKIDKLNQKELSTQIKNIENQVLGIEILPYSSVVNKGAGFILERLVN
jgi:GTP-binding protein